MVKRRRTSITAGGAHMRGIFREMGYTQVDVARKLYLLKRDNTKEAQADMKRITEEQRSFSEKTHMSNMLSGDLRLTLKWVQQIGQAIGVDYRYLLPPPEYPMDARMNFQLLRRLFPSEMAFLREQLRKEMEGADYKMIA